MRKWDMLAYGSVSAEKVIITVMLVGMGGGCSKTLYGVSREVTVYTCVCLVHF